MNDTFTDLLNEVTRAIYAVLESRMHRVGSVLTGEAKEAIIEQNIRDRDDFYRNTEYIVNATANEMTLIVGSNVEHEPFVLGGKVPSWTPFEPIKSWVERKKLNWTDDDGNQLTVKQMAWMIIGKIKREGIEPRNVFAEVVKNHQEWIFDQFTTLDVTL
jgi:hypothetical protein